MKSLTRGEKKSLRSLPRGDGKAAITIRLVKQQQIQFLSGSLCMETVKGRTQRKELSNPACSTSSLSHKTASHKLHIFTVRFQSGAPLAVQSAVKARAVQTKKFFGVTVIMTTFLNGVMEISKIAKTLNLAKKRVLSKLKLAKKYV